MARLGDRVDAVLSTRARPYSSATVAKSATGVIAGVDPGEALRFFRPGGVD